MDEWRETQRFEFNKAWLALLNQLDKGGKRRTSYIKGVRFVATLCKHTHEERERLYLIALGKIKPTDKLLADVKYSLDQAKKLFK